MTLERVPFETVQDEEREQIRKERERIRKDSGPDTEKPADIRFMGLGLSGGGIRSATFNLGVLQALARLGLLKEFDYLSTVSGGGYIGSWLSAWVWRSGGIEHVEKQLGRTDEPREVRYLREFSNYLTPKTGWLSADTLTGVSTWVRNLLLNLTMIIAVTAMLLLGPWLLGWSGSGSWMIDNFLGWSGSVPWVIVHFLVSVLLLLVAAYNIARNVMWQDRQETSQELGREAPKPPRYVTTRAITGGIVLPLVAWACMLSLPLQAHAHLLGWIEASLIGASAFASFYIVRQVSSLQAGRAARKLVASQPSASGAAQSGTPAPPRHAVAPRLLGLAVGTAIGVLLLTAFGALLKDAGTVWHAVVWGGPGVLLIFLIAVTFMLGLSGRNESEYAREWWSRLGGLLIRVAVSWLVVAAASVYGALIVWRLHEWLGSLSATWVISTIAAVLVGRSPVTGKEEGFRKWLDVIPKVGPYVFVLGLLVALSAVLYLTFTYLYPFPGGQARGAALAGSACTASTFGTDCPTSTYFEVLTHVVWIGPWLAAMFTLMAAAWLLSRTVDINLFSFHMFYRNRLTRCYLGASNPKRSALPFIGFDPRDNPKLCDLGAQRPYHLINTALNLTTTKRLGWQERKAGSFVLSPRYCGYFFPDIGPSGEPSDPCYQRTEAFGLNEDLDLGTAMAISGAAANPNMGYHSSPSVAFLLTLFNVRLGWWLQNPSTLATWSSKGPHSGLKYLLSELLGRSDERTPFVHVSDGGHFDNLGLYELVRRKCRFIVISDASQDKDFRFEDLGNAIRKCYVDHGARIEIRKHAMVPDPNSKRSLFHCAVGTVHYERRDGRDGRAERENGAIEESDQSQDWGYLLYIKPTLTGGEPSDVAQYAAASSDFPHEPTADQWFSESQFESYRRLGLHIAATVFEHAGVVRGLDRESIFVALKERWFPPAASGGGFSRQQAQLRALEINLRQDKNLRFLDAQVYPEWDRLSNGRSGAYETNLWLPDSYDELRAGFYFCSNMLDLMEDVYMDLNLEEEYDHPDNRGWMNVFRHWSWSGMFMVYYSVCSSMYGARFQRFCERRMEVRPGRLEIAPRQARKWLDWPHLLKEAEKAKELNFVEVEIINRLIAADIRFDELHLLQSVVWSPVDLRRKELGPDHRFVYTFGFALSTGKRLVYFRIQDHLRKMSHARRALSRLYHKRGITEFDPAPLEEVKDWLEPQDPEGFRQLLRSVADQPQDSEEMHDDIRQTAARRKPMPELRPLTENVPDHQPRRTDVDVQTD